MAWLDQGIHQFQGPTEEHRHGRVHGKCAVSISSGVAGSRSTSAQGLENSPARGEEPHEAETGPAYTHTVKPGVSAKPRVNSHGYAARFRGHRARHTDHKVGLLCCDWSALTLGLPPFQRSRGG